MYLRRKSKSKGKRPHPSRRKSKKKIPQASEQGSPARQALFRQLQEQQAFEASIMSSKQKKRSPMEKLLGKSSSPVKIKRNRKGRNLAMLSKQSSKKSVFDPPDEPENPLAEIAQMSHAERTLAKQFNLSEDFISELSNARSNLGLMPKHDLQKMELEKEVRKKKREHEQKLKKIIRKQRHLSQLVARFSSARKKLSLLKNTPKRNMSSSVLQHHGPGPIRSIPQTPNSKYESSQNSGSRRQLFTNNPQNIGSKSFSAKNIGLKYAQLQGVGQSPDSGLMLHSAGLEPGKFARRRVRLPKIQAVKDIGGAISYISRKVRDRKSKSLSQKQMEFMRKTNLGLFYQVKNNSSTLQTKKNRWLSLKKKTVISGYFKRQFRTVQQKLQDQLDEEEAVQEQVKMAMKQSTSRSHDDGDFCDSDSINEDDMGDNQKRKEVKKDYRQQVKFYNKYKQMERLDKLQKDTLKIQSVAKEYFAAIDGENLAPKNLQLYSEQGFKEHINLSHFKVGDQYIIAFAKAIKLNYHLKSLDLRNNRVTKKSAGLLMQSLPENLKELNLSQNEIGREACIKFGNRLAKVADIQALHFEGCEFYDDEAQQLSHGLERFVTDLLVLNLSSNHIGNTGAEYIGNALWQNKKLQQLYLQWNQIGHEGITELLPSLKRCEDLKALDLSHNPIGKAPLQETAQLFGKYVEEARSLVHLNVSYCNFDYQDCEILKDLLLASKSLLSLLISGNGAEDPIMEHDVGANTRNAKKQQDDDDAPEVPKKTKPVRIFKFLPGPQKKEKILEDLEQYKEQRPTNKLEIIEDDEDNRCWLCHKHWKILTFEYYHSGIATCPEPVLVHLDSNNWEGIPMVLKKKSYNNYRYTLRALVPPQPVQYVISTLGNKAQSDKGLPVTPSEAQLERLGSTQKQTVLIEKLKMMDVGRFDVIYLKNKDNAIKIDPKSTGVRKRKKKVVWKLRTSLFGGYKKDDPELIEQCFLNDWKKSKIGKLLNEPEQRSKVKKMLRDSYSIIKQIYKHLASKSPQKGVFAITQEVLVDHFAKKANLVDKNLRLADIDRAFIAATFSKHANQLCPPSSLVRHHFLEMIYRLAVIKYYESKQKQTCQEAVYYFLKSHIDFFKNKFNPNEFRKHVYWKQEVDECLRRNLSFLKNLYQELTKVAQAMPEPRSFVTLGEFVAMFEGCGVGKRFCVGKEEMQRAFNMAVMTQIDEMNSQRHLEMYFVEMIEAISRIAWALPQQPKIQRDVLQLVRKIEIVFQMINGNIFKGREFEIQTKEM